MDKTTFLDRYLTPIAVLLAGLIIGGALLFGSGKSDTAAPADGTGAVAVDVKNIDTDNDPYIGEKGAPVTMVLFYDYQCPFCKQFEQSVTPKLVDPYVKNGTLKIVFKDFQFLGQDSIDAAVFGRALWESQPEKFYDWYVAMFNAQDDEGDEGFGDMASVVALAGKVPGLDVAKVQALIEKNRTEYEKDITEDRSEGAAVGVNGTPSIVIGKQLLTGMSPDQFLSAITAEIQAETK